MARPRRYVRSDSSSQFAVRVWLIAHGCHVVQHGMAINTYGGGFVGGEPVYAVDVSKIGGWVDWLVWIGKPGQNISCAWECKEPKKEKILTDGEKVWRDEGPTIFSIVVTEMDCDEAARRALAWLDLRRLITSDVETEREQEDDNPGRVSGNQGPVRSDGAGSEVVLPGGLGGGYRDLE